MRKRIVTTSAVIAGLLLVGGGTAIAVTNSHNAVPVSEKSDKVISAPVADHAVAEAKSSSAPTVAPVPAAEAPAESAPVTAVEGSNAGEYSAPVNNGTPGVSNPHSFDFGTPGQVNPFVDYNPETAGNPIGGFTDNGGTVTWSENGDIVQ